VSPVQWEATMRQLVAQGVTQFFEIGPGRVLVGLLRRIDRKLSCENIAC
jgi:[acyl-carrier-protein] S-malonyltransferase